MRFAIAVGILAQTVPGLSDKEEALTIFFQGIQKRDKGVSKVATASLKRNALLQKLKLRSALISGEQRFNQGALKNADAAPVECNPNPENPDVGVLSCGDGKVCRESQDSAQGGFCTESAGLKDHRALQANNDFIEGYLCNATNAAYSTFVCDCDGFDTGVGYGIVECVDKRSPYCLDCVEPVCSEISFSYEFQAGGIPTLGYHYNFYAPYSQSVTYSYNDDGCSIDFDGEICQTCEPKVYYDANNETTYCFNFDCTNTKGNHAGSNCEGSSEDLPVATIASTCEAFVCDLCPGGELENLDGVIVVADQGDIPCSEILANANTITSPQCPAAVSLVADDCGCSASGGTTDPPEPDENDPPATSGPDDSGTETESPATSPTGDTLPADGAHSLVNAKNGIQMLGLAMAVVAYFAG